MNLDRVLEAIAYLVILGFLAMMVLAMLIGLGIGLASRGNAHDASMAADPEQARVFQFYSTWMRPKGLYAGMIHRSQSCCRSTDCFPVAETRMEHGQYLVRPESSPTFYRVPSSIVESEQSDPRESPDGRSHVCIIGGAVVCFVEGIGG